jgi:transcriptional regulator with XRE-family HTH domain
MVLGRILKQVRESRHFHLNDVASFTNISSTRLQEFETGDREPSFQQIEKLADAYGLPSYLLTSCHLPNLAESLPDFRRNTPQAARLSPRGMTKIWAAEKISHFTKQLSKALKYEKPKWVENIPEGKITRDRASQIREFFNEWLAERSEALGFSGTPEQRFLGGFRMFLEAQGTVVNINEAPADDFIGFYLNEDAGAPLTFINRSLDSRKAQLFTAVHE